MTTLPQMDTPEPPPPITAAPRQPSRLPIFLIVGAIALFLGFVLWSTRDNQFAIDLSVGQCFDRPSTSDSFTTLLTRECTEPHDAEVILIGEYPGGDASTTEVQINSYIDAACETPFAIYVGVAIDLSEDLTYGWFYPDQAGWDNGDRAFTCYVDRLDGAKLTASVKGSSGS